MVAVPHRDSEIICLQTSGFLMKRGFVFCFFFPLASKRLQKISLHCSFYNEIIFHPVLLMTCKWIGPISRTESGPRIWLYIFVSFMKWIFGGKSACAS